MSALDEATIALIKIDYEKTKLPVAGIEVKYGLSASYVSRLARLRGWKMRRPRKDVTATTLSPSGQQAGEQPGIATRLWTVITMKLDQMEKGMTNGELSAADLERDAKTIAAMIGGMQKVVSVPGEDKVSKPDVERTGAANNADEVARLQREIVERFERIQRRREAERGSL